jgi:mitochondrial fission protein ELM1
MADPIIIWQVSDNKRGHENQSSGLIFALSREVALEVLEINIATDKASWWQALRGQFHPARALQQPDLIIGAGSQTHSTILAASRATKAPSVLIMSPPKGLTSLFDLCISPEHDLRSGSNVVTTKGAMNMIEPGSLKNQHSGLFLIGGPSQHHDWDESILIKQIAQILDANPSIQWTLTSSRRTPPSTAAQLEKLSKEQLKVLPVEATGKDWLPRELSMSAYVWVTEDSVSMVYEALSSGAKVGLLPTPRKSTRSKVICGLESLNQEGYLMNYRENQTDLAAFKNPPPLNEAKRVAEIVVERFLASRIST